jgi:hypothetical protein
MALEPATAAARVVRPPVLQTPPPGCLSFLDCSVSVIFSCAQGIDAAVNGYWESRNAGKLFKHMTIPEQE